MLVNFEPGLEPYRKPKSTDFKQVYMANSLQPAGGPKSKPSIIDKTEVSGDSLVVRFKDNATLLENTTARAGLAQYILERAKNPTVKKVVLMLNNINEQIDSASVSHFLTLRKGTIGQGKELVLCAVNPESTLSNILQVTKLDKIFSLSPDLETALKQSAND